jgi:predicted Holliday junction resolvase-like endonuclease
LKKFLNILKWFFIILGVIFFILISSIVITKIINSSSNGQVNYRLSSIENEQNKNINTMFSCKIEDNTTDFDTYLQSKKTYDYLIEKLRENNFNNSKEIIFNRDLTLKEFGCQVVYWNKCSNDECLNNKSLIP